MGKKAGKKNGGSKSNGNSGSAGGGFSTLDVDPRHVRYAHSKIKPLFSGCGRTIEETLCEIREGKTRASDLPMITVLLGPMERAEDGQQQQCFFSLNNRRLFVFKACREEGLLGPSNLVRVRARPMKAHERERYTVERCSLQAKFLFAPKPKTDPNARAGPDADFEAEGEGEAQPVVGDVCALSALSLSAAPPIPPTDADAEAGMPTAYSDGLPRAAGAGAAVDRGGVETRRVGDEGTLEASAVAGVTRRPGAVEAEEVEEAVQV